MSEDCVVLLEELIKSNRDLAAENEKLRQEHEKTSKHQAEALNRIEQRLKEGETPGILRRRARPGAKEKRNIAVPAACRVSRGIAPFNYVNTAVYTWKSIVFILNSCILIEQHDALTRKIRFRWLCF